MLSPLFFTKLLQEKSGFVTGVPDSLLKQLCFCLQDRLEKNHFVIAANEGNAMGVAAGYHLATGNIPTIFMQNSGEGNIINPLLSLFDQDVYAIPCLLLIGWRGEPGTKDEPQHVTQGRLTIPLLDTMGIPYEILEDQENVAAEQLNCIFQKIKNSNLPFALVVKKNTFSNYTEYIPQNYNLPLGREEAIRIVADSLNDTVKIVSTTGMISRELFEYRAQNRMNHEMDFLTVGSMGHASQIALGIALTTPQREVACFDGDGALLMHMGGMAIIGTHAPRNFYHIVFNNAAHDSVGGIPTAGFNVSFPDIAKACGYQTVLSTSTLEELTDILKKIKQLPKPLFLEIKVRKGNRKDLGRPTVPPIQNKQMFMKGFHK